MSFAATFIRLLQNKSGFNSFSLKARKGKIKQENIWQNCKNKKEETSNQSVQSSTVNM